MGLEINALGCLLKLKKDKENISSVATIGRQCLHVDKDVLSRVLEGLNIRLSDDVYRNIFSDGYSENLLKAIGVDRVDSFDYCDYEKCTVSHDMNKPISEEYKNRYDVVFDGGSLEHIFNFPTAIKNCMEMVKIGGFFISVTTCNNYSGHGFYQFSPELFFRIFTKANGFELSSIYIDDNIHKYAVTDPEILQSRVTFQNSKKTFLVTVAKKIEDKIIFESTPMQSDYLPLWNKNKSEQKSVKSVSILNRIVGKGLKSLSLVSRYDKKMFKKI